MGWQAEKGVQVMTDGRDVDGAVEGKAAVRRLLIERLEAAGLQRPRGMAAAAFAQMQGHLCDRLSYMTAENLMTLAEALIESAQGGRWPGEIVVRDFAKGLQPPPVAQSRLITSWLASVEGPKAVVRGDLVELYRHLMRHLRPPSDWDRRQIAEQVLQNTRRIQIIREKIAVDVATAEERDWLSRYLADRQAAEAVVEQGNRKRAGEGQAA